MQWLWGTAAGSRAAWWAARGLVATCALAFSGFHSAFVTDSLSEAFEMKWDECC